jgi:hypothetical protein
LPLSSPVHVYLVFYRQITAGIEIVRVLHSARDIQRILAEEPAIEEDASIVSAHKLGDNLE